MSVTADSPVAVSKTNPMKVYAHYMPWFVTPETSEDGSWGGHWTMDNQNPDIVEANDKRQIASPFLRVPTVESQHRFQRSGVGVESRCRRELTWSAYRA